jgi:arylformamidase
MPLALEDDPDGQMPMPFAAAEQYAQQVMAWSRQVDVSGLRVQRDVAYGSHRLQRYDVFSPVSAHAALARRAPVLIFWHGGGWTNGYRQYVHFMAQHVCALGCHLVAPSYRLAPAHKLPAAYDDALAALAHVHAQARAWGADADHIFLSGHSAGGHLAALVALRRESSAQGSIRACLPLSGIMDLHHPAPDAGSLEERVYIMVLQQAAQDSVMSPVAWTADNRIAFDLSVGEQDSDRVRNSNQRLAALLALQHAPVQLHLQENHTHFQTHSCLADGQHAWYGRLAHLVRAELAHGSVGTSATQTGAYSSSETKTRIKRYGQ